MLCRLQPVSPAQIQEYSQSIAKDHHNLEFFSSFYRQHLLPILRHHRTLMPHYRPSLRLLLQTVLDKTARENPAFRNRTEVESMLSCIADRVGFKLPQRTRLFEEWEQQQYKVIPVDQNSQCLGCTAYFTENCNVRLEGITLTDAVVIKSVLKLRIYKQELKQVICALANSDGGVVLFDCIEQEGKILAKGDYLTEAVKESIMQQIIDACQEIIPNFEFAHHVSLSFVPVVAQANPNQGRLPFLEGVYVTRLRIWNHERDRLFFYSVGEELLVSYRQGKGEDRVTVELQRRGIMRLLKWRFQCFYIPVHYGEKEKVLRSKQLHCFEEHTCLEPESGIKVGCERSRPKPIQDEYVLENQFSYLSKITMGNVPVPKLITYLIKQKVSKFRFLEPKSALANDLGILMLFHDTSPHKLIQLFARVEGSPTLELLDYAIKLQTPLSCKVIDELYLQISSRQKGEELKYYEFPDRRMQAGFLETGCKVSVMYLWLKLKQLGFKQYKPIRLEHKNSPLILLLSKPQK